MPRYRGSFLEHRDGIVERKKGYVDTTYFTCIYRVRPVYGYTIKYDYGNYITQLFTIFTLWSACS